MNSIITDILHEWQGGCFYTDQLLAEAYTTFLLALLEATPEERQDPRIPAFLKAGFEAYLRQQHDPHAHLTYSMALGMVGAGARADTPPRPSVLVVFHAVS